MRREEALEWSGETSAFPGPAGVNIPAAQSRGEERRETATSAFARGCKIGLFCAFG